MHFALWGTLCLLALTSVYANVLDVCNMDIKDIESSQVHLRTVIRSEAGGDVTCSSFMALSPKDRSEVAKCYYMGGAPDAESKTWGWWPDSRWSHVLDKCMEAETSALLQNDPQYQKVVNICEMKQEEVENIRVGVSTVFSFSKNDLTCVDILEMREPWRREKMTCRYYKPEKVDLFSDGWDNWYDIRATIVYSKCLALRR